MNFYETDTYYIYVCVGECMYVCVCVCIYVYIYIYVCVYVCMYMCVYVCMYVCIYVTDMYLRKRAAVLQTHLYMPNENMCIANTCMGIV